MCFCHIVVLKDSQLEKGWRRQQEGGKRDGEGSRLQSISLFFAFFFFFCKCQWVCVERCEGDVGTDVIEE